MNRSKKICLIIAGIYFSLSLIMVFAHEAYSDEANQWLIAKNANIFDLPNILLTEGHPPLWYLILIPFAKLSLPLITANIISLLIMTIAVYLLVKHSPFKTIITLIIAMSGLFIYFLPVFARNYQIAVLGTILLCILYKNRFKQPIRYGAALALLAQSHMLVMGFAAAIGVIWAIELIRKNPKQRARLKHCIIGITLSLASGIIAVLPAFGTLETHGYLRISENEKVYAEFNSIDGYLQTLDTSLFGIQVTDFIFAILLIWVLAHLLVRGKQKQFFILLLGITFQAATLAYIYAFTKHQQDVLLLLMLLFAWWTSTLESSRSTNTIVTKIYAKFIHIIKKSEIIKLISSHPINANVVFILIFALTIPNTFYWALRDLFGEFSVAPAAARQINAVVPDASTIIVANAHIDAVALIPHLNPTYKIYDLHFQRELKYMIYNRQSTTWFNGEELSAAIQAQLPNQKNLYYVSPTCVDDFDDPANSYLNTLNKQTFIHNENVGDDKITTERCFALYSIN